MFQNGTSWILVSVSVMHPKSAAKVRKKSGLYKFTGGFLQNKFILHEKWRGNENMNTHFCVFFLHIWEIICNFAGDLEKIPKTF